MAMLAVARLYNWFRLLITAIAMFWIGMRGDAAVLASHPPAAPPVIPPPAAQENIVRGAIIPPGILRSLA